MFFKKNDPIQHKKSTDLYYMNDFGVFYAYQGETGDEQSAQASTQKNWTSPTSHLSWGWTHASGLHNYSLACQTKRPRTPLKSHDYSSHRRHKPVTSHWQKTSERQLKLCIVWQCQTAVLQRKATRLGSQLRLGPQSKRPQTKDCTCKLNKFYNGQRILNILPKSTSFCHWL